MTAEQGANRMSVIILLFATQISLFDQCFSNGIISVVLQKLEYVCTLIFTPHSLAF